MLRGVNYIHTQGVCHRDLKPHNMLVRGGKLVLCDFGSAKVLKPGETNISYICSRCYRAPELIFESTAYSTKIDMWSVGCILIEVINGRPLFVADCSLNHILEVIRVLGTPSREDVMAMNPDYDITEYDLPDIQHSSIAKVPLYISSCSPKSTICSWISSIACSATHLKSDFQLGRHYPTPILIKSAVNQSLQPSKCKAKTSSLSSAETS